MSSRIEPFSGAIAVTAGASPISTTKVIRGLIVGVGGDISFTCSDGTTIANYPAVAGQYIPGYITHVTAATATNIIAVY
jgi:hypothetical protein